MGVQTKKKNSQNRVGRTRKIINTLRHGFNTMRRHALNLEVKKQADVPKMDKLLLQPQVTFVLVKADWCGHCKNYEPKWKNFVNTPGRNANMVKMPVELQRNSQVLKNVSLEGVPTVLKVKNGTVTAVDIDDANDSEVMIQEVTRASNDPISTPALADAIVAKNPNVVEEEEEEPAGIVPTEEMSQLVNKVNVNPRNLGETNGSRKNDQAALNLAVPIENLKEAAASNANAANAPAPNANANVPAPVANAPAPAVAEKPINSINLVDLPSTNQPIQVAESPNQLSMPAPVPEPIPAPAPTPAPTPEEAAEEVPANQKTTGVNLSAPPAINAAFQKNAKRANNVINQAQAEIAANNDPSVTDVPPKQRGGRRTLKKKGALINFFRALTKKARKI
jgi:thiol-disulfide isomerase/thioredoxin